MGLDNGIVLRYKGDVEAPSYVSIERFYNENDEVEWEICYWRKCNGLRNDIVRMLGGENDDGEYDLSILKIEQIQDILYNTLKYPDDWNSQIWNLSEVMHLLAQEIVNLSWLKSFLREHPHATAYFYDSY